MYGCTRLVIVRLIQDCQRGAAPGGGGGGTMLAGKGRIAGIGSAKPRTSAGFIPKCWGHGVGDRMHSAADEVASRREPGRHCLSPLVEASSHQNEVLQADLYPASQDQTPKWKTEPQLAMARSLCSPLNP